MEKEHRVLEAEHIAAKAGPMAPTYYLIASASLFLLGVSAIIFAIADWHGFLIFMPWLFKGTIYACGAACILGLSAFAIKHVIGGWVHHVLVPERTSRVVSATDNFIAHLPGVEVKHHDDTRYNVSVKRVEDDQKALPSPQNAIPTARQLFDDGTVARIIRQGEIILGFLDDGSMKTLPYDLLYSTDLGGVGGSGKTTTAFWLCVQEIMAGTKLIVVDPHIHVRRRGIAQGLGQLLSPFQASYLFPPCDDTPEQVMKRAYFMRDENKRRQRPGAKLDQEPQVMMVVDEFNSIIEIEDIKAELGDIIATVQREGRKLGLFFLLVGHRWSQRDIGNVKIRTNASTVCAHYYNDPAQASTLLGGSGKLCQSLTTGSYYLRGLMTGELCKVSTPKITESDTPLILEMLPSSQVVPKVLPDNSNHNNGDHDGKQSELDFSKLARVREMVGNHASQNEIVTSVFTGMRNTDAIAEYRKYLAALVQEQGA